MHDELAETLRAARDIILIPNIGNAGDAFIAHATYRFFARIGLRYRIGRLDGVYPGTTVVYSGGGAMVEPYDYMVNFIRGNIGPCERLIVLPHSIRSYPEVLAACGDKAHFFCREQASYRYVREVAPRSRVSLTDDMAFGCDLAELDRLVSPFTADGFRALISEPGRAVRLWRRLAQDTATARTLSCNGVVNAFRQDVEKTDIAIPEANIDISDAFADDSMRPLVALHTTFRIRAFLGKFSTVRTNRLHVAIMATLMGLDVEFHDNNYNKNRDVYEQSMKGRFPRLRWMG